MLTLNPADGRDMSEDTNTTGTKAETAAVSVVSSTDDEKTIHEDKRIKLDVSDEAAKAGQEAETTASPAPPPPAVKMSDAIGPILARVKISEWQLFPPRLATILELEKEETPLTADLVQEKNKLLAMGFPLWERNDFRAFLQASIDRGGKDSPIVDLAAAIPHKDLDDVKKYAIAFWTRGAECFTADIWAMMMALMEKKKPGMRALEIRGNNDDRKNNQNGRSTNRTEDSERFAQANLETQMGHVRRKLQPASRLEFHKSLHTLLGQEYCQEEDKFLLDCFLARRSKEEIRQAVLKSPVFAFDHFFRSLSTDDLQRRLDTLVEVVEKDAEEMAKIEAKAQRDRERKEQEDAGLLKREAEILAKIDEIEKRGGVVTPVSTDLADASDVAPQPPHSPQPDDGQGDDGSDGGQASLDPKYHDQVLKMVIQSGTCGMAQLVDKVIRILPDGVISKRQLKKDIMLLAVKEKRAGDRAARWYPKEGIPLPAGTSPEQS